jgi:hypothetical protein
MNAYYTGKRDPINCPANQPDPKMHQSEHSLHPVELCKTLGHDQPDPTRDYHDVPFPEGTQPASGEWTADSVLRIAITETHDGAQAIADAHNAATTVAGQATGEWTVETIAVIRGRDGDFGLAAAINAALAAERAADANDLEVVIEKLEQQLAAERKKVQIVMRYIPACSEAAVKDALAKVKEGQ